MAPHSSTLAWKVPWMEEPGGLQSMGSQRVRHVWATSLSIFTFVHWRRKWQPTPVFLPGESQGQGSLMAAVYGVAQSRTWLKRLSSSSSSIAIKEFKILKKRKVGQVKVKSRKRRMEPPPGHLADPSSATQQPLNISTLSVSLLSPWWFNVILMDVTSSWTLPGAGHCWC